MIRRFAPASAVDAPPSGCLPAAISRGHEQKVLLRSRVQCPFYEGMVVKLPLAVPRVGSTMWPACCPPGVVREPD
jgi:hypothetical protein